MFLYHLVTKLYVFNGCFFFTEKEICEKTLGAEASFAGSCMASANAAGGDLQQKSPE